MKSPSYKKYFAVIKKKYPKVPKDQIKVYDAGWDHVVLTVNNGQAFRFPRTAEYKKKIATEAAFLKIFAPNSPVAIPQLTLHQDNKIGAYATYQFIKGIPFMNNVAETFTKEELLIAAKTVGTFLTVLHSFPKQKVKELDIKEPNPKVTWSKWFNKMAKGVFPHITYIEQSWSKKLFERYLLVLRKSKIASTVTHSDIFPEHLIVDPKNRNLTGIIDFGDVGIQDPAYDFAFLRYYGNEFLEEVYKHYNLAKDEYFEERRTFYERRDVLTDLEHALKLNDPEKFTQHKKRLAEQVKKYKV